MAVVAPRLLAFLFSGTAEPGDVDDDRETLSA
jgi:hypothetical protein